MVTMGRGSYGKIVEVGDGGIAVGKFCSIAGKVVGVTMGHNAGWVTTYPFPAKEIDGYPEAKKIKGHPTRKSIEIGNDVWIGQGTILVAPVSVGDGAIIGAGSVVRGFVLPYDIVFGNPALVMARRFSISIALKLRQIKWWDWPDEKIRANLHLLCSDRVEEFVDAHSKIPA